MHLNFDSCNKASQNNSKQDDVIEFGLLEAIEVIEKLKADLIQKQEASQLFGQQKDN